MRLADYLRRIGVRGPLAPDLDALTRLHAAHRETFLFENLAIQRGRPVSVAVEDVARKFLDEGGGGYCFEQNTLFASALADVGFAPVTLLGRVRRGPPERRARTHMVLRIALADRATYLADVGFGAVGLVEPMPLADGAASIQRGLTYTLRRVDDPDGRSGLWVLSMTDAAGRAVDLYEFSDDPQTPGDVIVANHYTSTHADSAFRRSLTIQSTRGDERTLLRSDVLVRYQKGWPSEEPVERARLPELARDLFGVELPTGPLVFDA